MNNQDFERLKVENNEKCITGPRAKFESLRTLKDREFERLGVNLLSYILDKGNGTTVLLREIRVTAIKSHLYCICNWLHIFYK